MRIMHQIFFLPLIKIFKMAGRDLQMKIHIMTLTILCLSLLAYSYVLADINIGYASFYSYECADQPMANGRPFDPEKRTCASWFYKFGTVLAVKSLDTERITEVIVTDRGPNKRLVKKGRIIDLSKRAFQDICALEKGLTRVAIEIKGSNKPL